MEKQAVVKIGQTPAVDGGISQELIEGEPIRQGRLSIKHKSGLSKAASEQVLEIIAQEQK